VAKDAIKPVYAFVGADPFLQLEAVRGILRELPAGTERADHDGEKAQLADVLDDLRSFSMFGPGKLVLVRDADEFLGRYREKLETFVTAIGEGREHPTGVLVLRLSSLPANQRIHKSIAKVGEVRKCDPPKIGDVPGWIGRRAKEAHRIDIDPDAARELAELVGNDLGRLDSEIGKLAVQATGPRITKADVAGSVTFQREQEIWEITTLLARGKAAEAVGRWRALVQADPSVEFRAITWLGIWLENCRAILQAKSRGTPMGVVAKQIRVWDDRTMSDYVATASRLGPTGVADLLTRLTDLDRRIKSGLAEAADNIERFIATALDY
jgi:DNA polymerase III subunit delta